MKRASDIDLFRIIATLLVIVLHVLGKGGILNNAAPDSAAYWTAWFLEICAYCAVNCFALISGYVMADKTVEIKSIEAPGRQSSPIRRGKMMVFIPQGIA